MRFATQQSSYRILALILIYWTAQWCLAIFGGNTASASGNSLFIAAQTYQEIFQAVPKDFSSGHPESLYYILGAISAKILGSSYYSYMFPNLAAFIALVLAAFFMGRRFAGPKAGAAFAAFAAIVPTVAGFSENYESPILEMALVLSFLLFFTGWLQDRKKWQYFAALGTAIPAVWAGTTYTYQALTLVHISLFMAVFCAQATIVRIREGESHREWVTPWLGAFVIGVCCSLLYLYIVRWGAELGYQVSEMERFSSQGDNDWWRFYAYYPANIFLQFLSWPSLAIITLGLLLSINRLRPALPWILCLILPVAVMLPFRKLDSVYVMETTPILIVLGGLAAYRLISGHKIWATIGIGLLIFGTGYTSWQMFEHRRDKPDILATISQGRPDYIFLIGQQWDEIDDAMDRIARCMAKKANDIKGKKNPLQLGVVVPPEVDYYRFLGRIVLARPYTAPVFLGTPETPPEANPEYIVSVPKGLIPQEPYDFDPEATHLEQRRQLLSFWEKKLHSKKPFARVCGLPFYRFPPPEPLPSDPIIP